MKGIKTVTLELTIDLHKKLKILAIEKGITLKDLLLGIIENGAK